MKKPRIEVIKGDITAMEVDAIVNAANPSLLGGGGVDGAIHRAAGPNLLDECLKIGGCEVGEAKITKGYDLMAGHIIHTVGPVWYGGINDEHALLAACYQNLLKIAKEYKFRTVAIPGISTGVYGFPKDQAALIAVTETKRFMKKSDFPEIVIFVAFDDENFLIYQKQLS
jgi:O-acetyl-ADP-ribose deacetylase (regulator of RNase III)